MASDLSRVRCHACDHEMREHGKNGRCFGVRHRASGAWTDCYCPRFRLRPARGRTEE